MLKTIGIIGSGLVGKAVARLSIAAGYNVVISNSRGPHTLTEVVKDLGPRARAGSVEEAIESGDIVTISIPLPVHDQLPAKAFRNKIVLDQTNYYPGMGDYYNDDLDKAKLTSSELIQSYLCEAKVVKGMHNIGWIHMEANARPKGDKNRTSLPVAGDDFDAKQTVMGFIDSIGFDVVDSGSLSNSWRIEPNTPIYFWPYAPEIPEGVSEERAKEIYKQPGVPIKQEQAINLIAETERPSPVGGTLEGMPPIHVAIFLELASANTIER